MPRTVAGHLGLANPFHQVPPPSAPKVQHAAAWEIRFKWISMDMLDVRSRAKISVLLWVAQALLKAPDIGYTQVASSTRHRLVTSVPRHGVMSSITLNEIIPRT